MCGIVGYIGKREAYPILIKGLKRLKYRGYDSAGVAIINDNQLLNVYRPQGETFVFASDGIIETPTVILQEFPSHSHTLFPYPGRFIFPALQQCVRKSLSNYQRIRAL